MENKSLHWDQGHLDTPASLLFFALPPSWFFLSCHKLDGGIQQPMLFGRRRLDRPPGSLGKVLMPSPSTPLARNYRPSLTLRQNRNVLSPFVPRVRCVVFLTHFIRKPFLENIKCSYIYIYIYIVLYIFMKFKISENAAAITEDVCIVKCDELLYDNKPWERLCSYFLTSLCWILYRLELRQIRM